MKNRFLFAMVLCLCACGVNPKETIMTPKNGPHVKVPVINGKTVEDFYKQFYYDKKPGTECKVEHFYLMTLDKTQSVTDPSLYFDIELFFDDVGGRSYHMRVDYYKKTGSQYTKFGDDSARGTWGLRDILAVLANLGTLVPKTDVEEHVTFKADPKIKNKDLVGINFNLYYRSNCFGELTQQEQNAL